MSRRPKKCGLQWWKVKQEDQERETHEAKCDEAPRYALTRVSS